MVAGMRRRHPLYSYRWWMAGQYYLSKSGLMPETVVRTGIVAIDGVAGDAYIIC